MSPKQRFSDLLVRAGLEVKPRWGARAGENPQQVFVLCKFLSVENYFLMIAVVEQ